MISIIVATDKNLAIGKNGELLFHIKEDLRRFKTLTTGHTIVMGRKTFESLPKGALPNRRNIVITRNESYSAQNVEIYSDIKNAVLNSENDEEIFIIGGGEIYRQTIDIADRIYLTEVNAIVDDADTFFPSISYDKWDICEKSEPHTEEKTGLNYQFITFVRKIHTKKASL